MDNKRENGSRRAYGMRKVNNIKNVIRPTVRPVITRATEKRRIEKNNKKLVLKKERIRAACALAAAAVFAVILVFMTPVFNIKEIRVEGNSIVEMNVIKQKIGDLIGTNLFSLRKGLIEKRLLEISQISSVKIRKNVIPPSLTVTIDESKPAAYMLSGSNFIVVDSELKIIDDSGHYNTDDLPSVSGISVSSYQLNQALTADSTEKSDVLKNLLSALDKSGLIEKVTFISIDDLTDIKFNYDNRLEVLCGSQLELDRKIRMFREAIGSETISSNSIGTIDLSVPGQAVYTP